MRNWPSPSASIPSNSSSGLIGGAFNSFTGVRTGTAAGIERPAGRSDTTGRAGWFSDRARAAARASGEAGATMAPGMGAFFPVGTFASLTGADGGGGGGTTSATMDAGSVEAGPAAGAAAAFADALVAFTGSVAEAAAGPAFFVGAGVGALALGEAVFPGTGAAATDLPAVVLAEAVFTGATLAGAGFAETGLAATLAATDFAATGLAGADVAAALAGTFAATTLAAALVGAEAAFVAADAALVGAVFPGTLFADAFARAAFAGGALAVDALGDGLALALAGATAAFAGAPGFTTGFVGPLGVIGDFILVGDADRVGEGTGFAVVTLAEARFTGTAVFADVGFEVLVTGLSCVIFGAIDFFGAAELRAFAVFVAVLGLALVTVAFLAASAAEAAVFAAAFEASGLVAVDGDDFFGFDDGAPALAVGLLTTFFGTGAAFFAPADFADLRAGIDFDGAATMYSRVRCRRDREIPGKAGETTSSITRIRAIAPENLIRRHDPCHDPCALGHHAHSESAAAIGSASAYVDVDAKVSGSAMIGPAPSLPSLPTLPSWPSSSWSSRAR